MNKDDAVGVALLEIGRGNKETPEDADPVGQRDHPVDQYQHQPFRTEQADFVRPGQQGNPGRYSQRQQYEQLARPLDEEIRNRQAEERNKVLALIKSAIDAVAEREKFDVVLNSGAAVYAKPEYDISEAVAAQVSKAK